jgi:hypothetical protein
MQLERDFEDFLQNVEATVIGVYRDNPELKDEDVLKAYDKLIAFYERKKKRLPEIPTSITGNAAQVLDAVKKVCEWRRKKDQNEHHDSDGLGDLGNDVPIAPLLRCLEKLRKSVDFWKKTGVRAYLTHVSKFV